MTTLQAAKLVEDEDSEGGGGVSRETEADPPAEDVEEGMKRLSNEAARALAFPLLLLLLRPDREVVLDQVFEQLSMTIAMDVTFLPVAVVGCAAVAFCRSLLPPDFSDTSLAGPPVAEANDIFSSSNSTTGPEAKNKDKKFEQKFKLNEEHRKNSLAFF